jgi:hypothetical protein
MVDEVAVVIIIVILSQTDFFGLIKKQQFAACGIRLCQLEYFH